MNDAGQPCVISARLALPEITQRSGFRLARGTPPPCAGTAADGGFPDVEFAGDLSDHGGVHVELETTRTGRRALRAILTAHHPGAHRAIPVRFSVTGSTVPIWAVSGPV